MNKELELEQQVLHLVRGFEIEKDCKVTKINYTVNKRPTGDSAPYVDATIADPGPKCICGSELVCRSSAVVKPATPHSWFCNNVPCPRYLLLVVLPPKPVAVDDEDRLSYDDLLG